MLKRSLFNWPNRAPPQARDFNYPFLFQVLPSTVPVLLHVQITHLSVEFDAYVVQ